MVFLSSQTKLENLPDIKEAIYKYNWFLFSTRIQSKNTKYDDELYSIGNRLLCYPLACKEPLFNYLMTDHYYFKSNLYKTMGNTAEIVGMRHHKYETTFIPEEERIFGEKDIVNMFDYFKRNNFRETPIYEYTLPNQ